VAVGYVLTYIYIYTYVYYRDIAKLMPLHP
jgi:hypothetical protein